MNTIQLPFVADRCLGRFVPVSDERRLQLTNSLSSSMDCSAKKLLLTVWSADSCRWLSPTKEVFCRPRLRSP